MFSFLSAAPGIISASPYGGAHAFPPTFAIQQAAGELKIFQSFMQDLVYPDNRKLKYLSVSLHIWITVHAG